MIALCAHHAKMADSAVYSKQQLKYCKTNPYVSDSILALWPWEPETLVFLMGGCVFFGVRSLLTLRNREVFGAAPIQIGTHTRRSIIFDLDLVDTQGNPIVDMKQNWLTIHVERLKDLKLKPGAKQFFVSHLSGLQMNIRFNRYTHDSFIRRLSYITKTNADIVTSASNFAQEHSIDSDGLIPVVTLTGKLFNEDVTLSITERTMELDCHFYYHEKVRPKPVCYLPSGSLSVDLEGVGQILRFG